MYHSRINREIKRSNPTSPFFSFLFLSTPFLPFPSLGFPFLPFLCFPFSSSISIFAVAAVNFFSFPLIHFNNPVIYTYMYIYY